MTTTAPAGWDESKLGFSGAQVVGAMTAVLATESARGGGDITFEYAAFARLIIAVDDLAAAVLDFATEPYNHDIPCG